ncbi:LLM class flavin-dependent oxidoreductase [Streptomyces cyaneofuscatus]|uniref:LLM class flavin-dependent oxidoreductase n=1 Tax=Streptomyces cyaneofuscatus TaxID=66883 RepID=UPI0036649848
MTVYGFHASHEQVPPADLLGAAVHAESAGFAAAMCSDHFSPWSVRQGESGLAWSWLGAALQATDHIPFGVVNAPGQRYHPAIIAQAIGSLAAMYPGRFWAALGSGEASNEHITGARRPRKDVRNARLRECVDIIRALLKGEEVSHDGLVVVDRARLWTRPETVPPLVGAACSEATARWCAEGADGLITVNAPREKLRRIVDAQGAFGPKRVNVHDQAHDADSLLGRMRTLIERYRATPELAWGTYEVLDADDPGVLAHISSLPEGAVPAVHNFSDRAVTAATTVPGLKGGRLLTDVFTGSTVKSAAGGLVRTER